MSAASLSVGGQADAWNGAPVAASAPIRAPSAQQFLPGANAAPSALTPQQAFYKRHAPSNDRQGQVRCNNCYRLGFVTYRKFHEWCTVCRDRRKEALRAAAPGSRSSALTGRGPDPFAGAMSSNGHLWHNSCGSNDASREDASRSDSRSSCAGSSCSRAGSSCSARYESEAVFASVTASLWEDAASAAVAVAASLGVGPLNVPELAELDGTSMGWPCVPDVRCRAATTEETTGTGAFAAAQSSTSELETREAVVRQIEGTEAEEQPSGWVGSLPEEAGQLAALFPQKLPPCRRAGCTQIASWYLREQEASVRNFGVGEGKGWYCEDCKYPSCMVKYTGPTFV